MAIIKAPNDQYTGVSASVFFVNGEGETDDPNLIDWFKEKGYEVIEDGHDQEVEQQEESTEEHEYIYDNLTVDEIKALLDEKGIEYKARDGKQALFNLLIRKEKEGD